MRRHLRAGLVGAGAGLLLAAALSPTAAAATRLHPDRASTPEDSSTRGNVLSNDFRADGELRVVSFHLEHHPTTVWAPGAPGHPHGGRLAMSSDGTWSWNPKTDWNGHFRIVYTTNSGASTTLDLTTSPVNDPPHAHADSLDIAFGTVHEFISLHRLTHNDTDVDGDWVEVASVFAPVHCTVRWSGGAINFETEPGYRGVAEFRYTVEDSSGATSRNAVVHVNLS